MPGLYKITHAAEITELHAPTQIACNVIDSIQGYPVSDTEPTFDQVLKWTGINWTPQNVFGGLSDINLKTNVSTIKSGLDIISKLNPVSFNWKKDNEKIENFGLIAQELKQAFNNIPHAAYNDKNEFWTVNYIQLIAPLIKSIQELSNKITILEQEIQILKSKQ